MTILPIALRLWKPLLALALAALCFGTGWQVAGWKHKADQLEQVRKDFDAVMDANARAASADTKLQAELMKPKAGVKIREVVRNNPSDCRLPAPVGDGLREAIRSANDATR